jgi:hypothetical protein
LDQVSRLAEIKPIRIMNPLVLTFDHSGTGSCLYSELIDLTQIGALQIRRASTIKFNNDTQRWELKNLKGKVVFFSKFHHACRAWEEHHFAR